MAAFAERIRRINAPKYPGNFERVIRKTHNGAARFSMRSPYPSICRKLHIPDAGTPERNIKNMTPGKSDSEIHRGFSQD
jgi:hypothetical protein